MARFTTRRKTSRPTRRKHGGMQKLHVNVTSPRIVMYQAMRAMGKGLKLILLLAIIGGIGWGSWKGVQHLFLGNEKYRLREIDVQTNGHIDPARVVDVTGIDIDASLFAIKTTQMRKKLDALPEVMECEVERRLPGTLKVILTERVPIVWLKSRQLGYPGCKRGGVLADKDGITFPCEGAMWETAKSLPTIIIHSARKDAFKHGSKMKHAEARRALHLIDTFASSSIRKEWLPESIEILNDYSMRVSCNDGSSAIFGMYDHQRQLEDFITIREHALKTQREILYVNLIPKKNIPVKFAGAPVLVKPLRQPQPLDADQLEIQSILDRN